MNPPIILSRTVRPCRRIDTASAYPYASVNLSIFQIKKGEAYENHSRVQ